MHREAFIAVFLAACKNELLLKKYMEYFKWLLFEQTELLLALLCKYWTNNDMKQVFQLSCLIWVKAQVQFF